MGRIEKTVFISYRRTNIPWVLAISQNLTHHGYDVFFDFSGIASGDFEQAILGNIKSRAHFLVLLTPSALKRCSQPGDWLRCEIETAFESRRNIVPLMLEGFDFKTPGIAKQLTGTLAPLLSYNALRIPSEYFDEAMERLRAKFLDVALEGVSHPASASARSAAKEQQAAVRTAPPVLEKELTAQEWFERGFYATDPDEQIGLYSQAIRLKPTFAEAFINRGIARRAKADVEGAIADYNKAIRLKPHHAEAFYNRGIARQAKGDVKGAIAEYNKAIRLKPAFADAFINRGSARQAKGDVKGAIADYNKAIILKPDSAVAFYNRGIARGARGDAEGEIADYDEAIRLKPDYAIAFNNRGVARGVKGDMEGEIADYNEAIRLKPDDADAFHNRGIAREAKGDAKGAVQDHKEANRLGYKPRR